MVKKVTVAFPKPNVKKKTYTMKKADKLFSLYVRSREVCQAKGLDKHECKGKMECAHIVTRGNKNLRFDENNALCLCQGHHYYYTLHPDEWYWDFIPTHYPKMFNYVQRHRYERVKNTADRMREISTDLDWKLTKLGIVH